MRCTDYSWKDWDEFNRNYQNIAENNITDKELSDKLNKMIEHSRRCKSCEDTRVSIDSGEYQDYKARMAAGIYPAR